MPTKVPRSHATITLCQDRDEVTDEERDRYEGTEQCDRIKEN